MYRLKKYYGYVTLYAQWTKLACANPGLGY